MSAWTYLIYIMAQSWWLMFNTNSPPALHTEQLHLRRCSRGALLSGISSVLGKRGVTEIYLCPTIFFQSLCGIEALVFQSLLICCKM